MRSSNNLKKPQVSLNVAKASLELCLETIPGGVRLGGVGWGWSYSDYKAISVQLQLQLPTGTELGNRSGTGVREMSNFYISLEKCPKGGPFDDFFHVLTA